MVYAENDYLMLSGIQHFQFCKRQWSLIHIEQQWSDNEATAHGQILHKKADDPYVKEKRNDVIISRAMHVSSKELGLYGILDVVEFHKDERGIELKGRSGKWLPIIVEYKRGKDKKDIYDIVQLVAQAICLEETLGCTIEYSYLYYHRVNQKKRISEYFKNCQLCSLVDICMPRLSKKNRNIDNYIFHALKSEDGL